MFSPLALQGLTIILGITAISLNLVLIPLLLYRSKYELGNYKIIMILFSIVNILHYVVDFFTLPSFFIHEQSAIIYAAGYSGRSQLWGTLTVVLESVLFFTMTLVECMHFLYRYIVLCKQEWAWLLSAPYMQITGILLIAINIVYHVLNFYFLLQPDQELRLFIANTTLETMNISSDAMFGVSTLYTSPRNGDVRWNNIIGIGNLLFNQFLMFGIMIFCGLSIVRELKSFRIRSNRRRHLHIQLFKALLAQTTNPVLMLHLPCAALVVLPMFRLSLDGNAEYLMIVILLYPILEPLIVMYFVIDRRKTVLNCLKSMGTSNWSRTSTTSNSIPKDNVVACINVQEPIQLTNW